MTNTNTDSIRTITDTMIAQLGGRAIFAMAFTAATYGWDAEAAVLTLKIAPALVRSVKGRATHITIRLEADDTYSVWAIRCARRDVSRLEAIPMVHADSLRAVVEGATGLRLTLGRMAVAS